MIRDISGVKINNEEKFLQVITALLNKLKERKKELQKKMIKKMAVVGIVSSLIGVGVVIYLLKKNQQ